MLVHMGRAKAAQELGHLPVPGSQAGAGAPQLNARAQETIRNRRADIDLPSSALPAMVAQATGSSNPKSSSMEVSITELKPKIFCLRFGFCGSRRTPILASMSAGNLGQRKKKESISALSSKTTLVIMPFLRMISSPAFWSSYSGPKILLKMPGICGSAC